MPTKDEQITVQDDKYPKVIYCLPGESKIVLSHAEIKEMIPKKKSLKLVQYRADKWVKFKIGTTGGLVIDDEEDITKP